MQKLQRRQRALDLTSSLNEASKQDLKRGLIAECTSAEESMTEAEDEREESSDDDNIQERERTKKKKLVVRPLSWRSPKFSEALASLDRKWNRHASEKSKTMAKPRCQGQVVECHPPEGISNWITQHIFFSVYGFYLYFKHVVVVFKTENRCYFLIFREINTCVNGFKARFRHRTFCVYEEFEFCSQVIHNNITISLAYISETLYLQ
jgi:hypothetical protein